MFKKDILLMDLEMSGLDPERHEILQIAAVLLDRKTLKEKKTFVSYVRPKRWELRDPRAIEVCQITYEMVKSAPQLKTVLRDLVTRFGSDVTFAKYGSSADEEFLKAGFKKTRLVYPYDYHHMDLWPLFYIFAMKYGLQHNRKKFHGFSLGDLAKYFDIHLDVQRHDALGDCKITAEVFRKIMKEIYV